MTNIAVLGTGRMGSALVQALLAQGHAVSVWNRTASRAGPLVERGARLADSVLEAVSGAELIVGILSDYTTSHALLHTEEISAALRGKTLVQLASGSPSEARAAAAWARARDVRYLDGAIMATPDLIGKPESAILYAGERALFDASLPTLSALAGTSTYVGAEVGLAAALDSSLLVLMWGVLFGALHGVAISQAEGIALPDYLAQVKNLLPVTDAFAIDLIERAIAQKYEQTQATLETHHLALQHVLEIARERGLDPTIPDAFDKVMQRGRERGLGGLDFTALLQLLR